MDATPDPLSVADKVTVTAVLRYQPVEQVALLQLIDIVGGVVSCAGGGVDWEAAS